MSKVLSEITGLSDKDCFYIVERHKNKFTYPLHCHRDYELNFISNGAGVRRIIGDSIETIGPYELVLVTGENLEHVWEQGSCTSEDIREITIQFSPDLFDEGLLSKNQFESIRKMFDQARQGLCFPQEAIMKVYSKLDTISLESDSFTQVLHCIQILHELSCFEGRKLSTSAFAKAPRRSESHRVETIKDYIHSHYAEPLLPYACRPYRHGLYHGRASGQCGALPGGYQRERIGHLLCLRVQQPVQFQPCLQGEEGDDAARFPPPVQEEKSYHLARNLQT